MEKFCGFWAASVQRPQPTVSNSSAGTGCLGLRVMKYSLMRRHPREHPAAERTTKRDEQRRGPEIPDQDQCARIMIVKNRQRGRRHSGHREAPRNRDPRRREQRRVTQHDEHGERERHTGQDEQREAPSLVPEGKTARLKAHPVDQTPIAYGRYPHEERWERQKQPRPRAVRDAQEE